MGKQVEYDLIVAHDAGSLASLVDKYIADGWQVIGGVSVCQCDESVEGYVFHQSVVLYEIDVCEDIFDEIA